MFSGATHMAGLKYSCGRPHAHLGILITDLPLFHMLTKQLHLLAHLAQIDGEISDQERKLIHSLGHLHGFEADDVEQIIIDPTPVQDLSTLSPDEKYEYLYNIVQLMKIDGKVYKTEISFCQEMAAKLGYKKSVIAELSSYIYSDPGITADRDILKARIAKFSS